MEDFFNRVSEETRKVIEAQLSKKFVAFDKNFMPNERGVYFIYEKQSKELVYIGCAYAENRTIKKRCSQYLGTSKRGATFRNKIIKDKLKKEPILKGGKKNISAIEQGIKYIKANYELKFITVDEKTSPSQILLLERSCISEFSPKYND